MHRETKRPGNLKDWEMPPLPPPHTICQKSTSNNVSPVAFHCVLVNFRHLF
ncbi:unnamed protein product [Hymenolepis diminuta]|uniref:Uncharacterized protein n=1 Tax=Hymenolepis diminuta TaxID=6216 RepID=A0A564Z4I2_HYMDI|nr:unnamed protein product [Hymenolepis diminuta]